MIDDEFYRTIDDPRGYLDEYPYPAEWRAHLRENLYKQRQGRSDLTQQSLRYGFEMHEGLFSRAYVPKAHWQQFLFAGPNVFLLSNLEHQPQPPDRTTCFWLSVARYGLLHVQKWIESLPFKSDPGRPWQGTIGIEVLARIPDCWPVADTWYLWFASIRANIEMETYA